MAKARKAPKPDSPAAPQAETPRDAGPCREMPQDAAAASDAQPDSHETPKTEAQSAEQSETAQATQQAGQIDAGNVPEPTAELDAAALTAARACVRERLQKHPEWPRIVATVREMRSSPELAAMTTEHRERFIWGEMDRLYPATTQNGGNRQSIAVLSEPKSESPEPVTTSGVRGLGEIPASWPPLPANAALSAELAWVQANRLYVVEELASGGTRVHLDRAHEPAPSRSAIGWLETSIRSYAKFVEVAAKASGPGDDEGEMIKREKMQIEEIRGLLSEMAGNPPAPGR